MRLEGFNKFGLEMPQVVEQIPAKVVVAGLDNAGKTSLLIALDKKFEYEDNVKKLTPTQGIHRTQFSFLNREIVPWDFGGQEKYREIYLAQMERNFYEISLFFYVIDIQDQSRFADAINYFGKIAQFFHEKEITAPIIILTLVNSISNGFQVTERLINLRPRANGAVGVVREAIE